MGGAWEKPIAPESCGSRRGGGAQLYIEWRPRQYREPRSPGDPQHVLRELPVRRYVDERWHDSRRHNRYRVDGLFEEPGTLRSALCSSPNCSPSPSIATRSYSSAPTVATAVPRGFTRGLTVTVRLTEQGSEELEITAISGLVIVPSTQKAQPPLSYLIAPGFEPDTGFINIQVDAIMTFFGRTLSGDASRSPGRSESTSLASAIRTREVPTHVYSTHDQKERAKRP